MWADASAHMRTRTSGTELTRDTRMPRLVGDVAGRSRLPEKWQIKTGPQRSPLQLRASALDVGKIESQFECPLVQVSDALFLPP